MGKQTKRRQRIKNKNSGESPIPQRPGKISSISTPVINRVRHGDIHLRHGALTGLSTTLFSPHSLSTNHELIKYELVQAVSERIMDQDMPTALCAAGCMGNYCLFGSQQVDFHKVGAMVLPITLARLKSTTNKACEMQQQLIEQCESLNFSSERHARDMELVEKQARRIIEQWTLISLCLNIIVALIENSDSDDSSPMLSLSRSDDILDVIFQIASNTAGILSHSPGLSSSSTDHAIRSLVIQDRNSNIFADCSHYAIRALHSSLDENPLLIRKLLSKSDSVIHFFIHTVQNTALPSLSRLHAASIIVELSHYPYLHQQLSQPWDSFQSIDDIIVQLVIPTIRPYLVFHSEIALAMMQRIKVTEEEMELTHRDEALEKEVITSVNRQKENSRIIARRQAAAKGMAMPCESKTMVEEDGHQTQMEWGSEDKGRIHPSLSNDVIEDAFDRHEKSISAWNTACSPLKLALEIAANMCASREQLEENVPIMSYEKIDVDTDDWDEERERQLIDGMTDGNPHKQRYSEACQQLLLTDIPGIVLTSFSDVFINCTVNSWNRRNNDVPLKSSLDVEDILLKCGSCLGNMMSVKSKWLTEVDQASAVWKRFCSMLNEVLCRSSVPGHASVISAITHVLGSLIRYRPSIIPVIDTSDLSSISQCVSFGLASTATSIAAATITDIQKDSVNILGELCRYPHSDELNAQVCNILLNYLRNFESAHTSVMMEILNVLMDMYSADESDANNHELIFRSCDVLSIFHRYIPLLKKRIAVDRSIQSVTPEYPLWEEILLNAKRFVHYKKSRS